MSTEFKTIGILGKSSAPEIADTLKALYQFLKTRYQVSIDSVSAKLIPDFSGNIQPIKSLAQHCHVLIAVGGDGTFLSAARIASGSNIPLIGINLGRLGFLVDISPAELETKLNDMLQGHYRKEQRFLLRTKIIRNAQVIHEETAVNEVVVHRWVTPSMIELKTTIDGVYLNTQRSDGLIISTPTGSTAYSLSAGGPIIHPALDALLLVPLNPHTLSNRPIVINASAEIEISFVETNEINAQVTCDHIAIPDVLISDTIFIKKDPNPITILHPENHDFFHTLRDKLNWSSGYHF
ncbi:NAD kinase [Methylococcaceae bacterium HT4]|nr:NAD(+) kinase [Methyloprofundus sp.]TXK96520.1 NAD kinase [Methylococcaceae bacterium CS5]TXK99422.1 NAD kinase [Methylococcaceae bacterium CS4]TXL04105.1 NAD kinase [Methylococcaceae bacterium CS1]TXL05674.1 NAD kinase [Methylococcaceae bacterium CS3]TXL10111.1 NAD kinase [Methylococcaceae bacterium CS2]TXL13894.1 NAD kinase [Methylococcaceae bacterium HT4]TXL19681.1 NAD kinase [Methylococcaceae bacterium HT5]